MADMVREWKRAVHEPEIAKRDATIAALTSRVAEIEAALRPLARACCTEFGVGNGEPDNASVYVGDDDDPVITFGLIRNALRVLGELNE